MTNKVIKILSLLFFFLAFSFPLIFTAKSFSQSPRSGPSVTIINLIRSNQLGHPKDDIAASLKAQLEITSEQDLNATWLLQYSTLEDKKLVDFAKNKMQNQELGLLFEIDRNFAAKSNVLYRGQGEWYFSDGLFLNSYDVNERRKLIDTAFSKFKNSFGYYPKTVGAWWIGGDSLSYMHKKYAVTAALRAADQYNLDFYSIWGTPWSIPYLSSKENEGIPASSFDDSSGVVILQWAARDPLNGYKDPLYSVQDYPIKQYDTAYVDYLASIFLRKPLDNLVFGLENGGTKKTFSGYYKTMLLEAKKLQTEKKAVISLAKDYSSQFLQSKKVFSDNNYYLSSAYKSEDQSFWFNSGNFRLGIQKIGDEILLVDLRDYRNKVQEDFNTLPNAQAHLRINTPEIIDTMNFPDQEILIAKSKDNLKVIKSNGSVILLSGTKEIVSIDSDRVQLLDNSKISSTFDFTTHKKNNTALYLILGIYLFYIAFIYFYKKNLKLSLTEFFPLIIPLIAAIPFLFSFPNFLFDRKELLLMHFLPLASLPIEQVLTLIKVIPLILLLLFHFVLVVKGKKYISKLLFIFILLITTCLYINFPYFPLDRSTYLLTAIILGSVFLTLIVISLVIFYKTKSRRLFAQYLLVSLIFLGILSAGIFLSRSKYILTPFEINALNKIKIYNRNVIYVAPQEDYSIVAIYKEIKPVLNYDYRFGEKFTGKTWTKVIRPANHILNISDYDNKLIVVPRYLGADLSDYEVDKLGLKKIFDNFQIAVFEKK